MSRDLRKYARQTNFRLALGGILVLFVVGGGLIWVIYGRDAAILGFICLAAGLAPIGLVWLALGGLERLARLLDKDH
jgi:hypothetical protein